MKKDSLIKFILGAVLMCALAVTVSVFLVKEVNNQAALLQEQVSLLEADFSQQTKLNQIKRLIADTETARMTLSSSYLQSQSDSIDFLNYVEGLSTDSGVIVNTDSATESDSLGRQILVVRYSIDGEKLPLERFIRLLETTPYVAEVVSVNISQQRDGLWGAVVEVEVTVLQNENETIE